MTALVQQGDRLFRPSDCAQHTGRGAALLLAGGLKVALQLRHVLVRTALSAGGAERGGQAAEAGDRAQTRAALQT